MNIPNLTPTIGNWIHFDDGETKEFSVLSGNPRPHQVHWIGGQGADCTGPGCSICAMGTRPSMRWSVDVIYQAERRTWEMANLTWETLSTIASTMGGLAGLRLKVVRTGLGRNTRYTIVPLGRGAIPALASTATQAPLPQAPQGTAAQTPAPGDDDRARAEYAKQMAAMLGSNTQTLLAEWRANAGEAAKSASTSQQIALFCDWLEQKLATAQAQPAPVAPATPSLDDLLA